MIAVLAASPTRPTVRPHVGTASSRRNNWLVALLAHGEGWHNNHHADQRAAAHGHRWWELDMSWWVIRGLEAIGLATDVVRPRSWHPDRHARMPPPSPELSVAPRKPR